MAHVTRSWEIWIEFQTLGFALAQTWLLWAFEE